MYLQDSYIRYYKLYNAEGWNNAYSFCSSTYSSRNCGNIYSTEYFKSIKRASVSVTKVAGGDLTVEVDKTVLKRQDEIGDMAEP